MKKMYTLLDYAKTEDFPFSINVVYHSSEMPLHTHDCTELVIILEGKAVHMIDGEEYCLKAGDVFVVHGSSEHGYKNCQNMWISNLMFDYDRLIDINSELKQLPGFQSLFILEPFFRKEHKFESKLVLDPLSLNFVKDFLNILLKEYEEQIHGFKPVIRSYFLSLVAYLSRQFSSGHNKVSGKLFLLANAVSYIENNYLNSIHIDDIASMAFLSTRQFSRIFKRNYNASPKEYIIRLRLDYACKLIRNSDKSFSLIAMECGFSDISFFSRQFKEKFGISPKEYRKSFYKLSSEK